MTMRNSSDAVGYIRVSTGRQEISPEAQQEKIIAYASLRALNVVQILKDVHVSGSIPVTERPEGSKILSFNPAHIITVKLDRLFRDAADCLIMTRQWDEQKISLHILDMGGNSLDTSSAMGRMFLTVASGFAEMERTLICERTRVALRYKIDRGERTGRIPFGFDLDPDGVHLSKNPLEQDSIAGMIRRRSEGQTLREICEWLNSTSIRPKSNKRWRHTTLMTIMRSTTGRRPPPEEYLSM